MSADRNRSESWAAEYAERSTRWSTKPEQAQAGAARPPDGLDNVEFVDIGIGTMRIDPRRTPGTSDNGEPIPVLLKPPKQSLKRRGADIIRDMFGHKVAPPRESVVLPSLLKALQTHPRVAFAHRVNVGGVHYGKQYVAYGEPGMCDLSGMLTDGRRLEVEGKRLGEKPRAAQILWMDKVRRFGGIAFVAYAISDIERELGPFGAQRERPIA